MAGIGNPSTPLGHDTLTHSARRLSTEPGWVAPAFIIAAAFIIVAADFLVRLIVPAGWAVVVIDVTCFAFLAVGLLATLRVAGRAFQVLIRLGAMGVSRSRWWFEVGRLNVIALVFALLAMMALFFLWMSGLIGR